MTSRPKWEELARDGSAAESSSVASALTYTLCLSSWKSKFILKEEQKLALFSGRDIFVWLPTRVSVPNASVYVLQAAHSAGIHQ